MSQLKKFASSLLLSVVLLGGIGHTAQAKAAATAAPGGPFGLGVVLGAPTAITGKYWLDSRDAVDMGLAFNVYNYVLIYADYLLHFPGVFGHQNKFVARLEPYLGVGGLIAFATTTRSDNDHYLGTTTGAFGMGARIPLGLNWRPLEAPLEVFLELVPGISLFPSTGLMLQGGIGIRYYF